MIKKIFVTLLIKISRIIYWIIPIELKKSEYDRHLIMKNYFSKQALECFDFFKNFIEKAMLFQNHKDIQKYAIKNALLHDYDKKKFYLEFGIYKGTSANFFADYLEKLYGFDSFMGLREDWIGHYDHTKDTFDLKKKIPKLKKNIKPIVGWVQDTLENFLTKHNPSINFVHMDLDTYESSKYVLEKIKPYLNKNATILFDELYNHPGWKIGELKALQETFNENEYTFKAFNIRGAQVVIQLN